jgi:hypothetical protein
MPAWFAPLLAMLLTLLMAFFLSIGVGFSGMACDVGSSPEISRCNASVVPAAKVYFYGLLPPAGLLLASWVLPWRRGNLQRPGRLARPLLRRQGRR